MKRLRADSPVQNMYNTVPVFQAVDDIENKVRSIGRSESEKYEPSKCQYSGTTHMRKAMKEKAENTWLGGSKGARVEDIVDVNPR